MTVRGKTVWVVNVWLMALLTLFAGSPRIQCRCPDGRVKLFCLSSFFPAGVSGCCCTSTQPASRPPCCPAPDGPPAAVEECPCCAHTRECQHGMASDHTSRIDPIGCTKTLTQTRDPAAIPPGMEPDDNSTAVLRMSDTSVIFQQRDALSSRRDLLPDPPPTDLITVLQRLTI